MLLTGVSRKAQQLVIHEKGFCLTSSMSKVRFVAEFSSQCLVKQFFLTSNLSDKDDSHYFPLSTIFFTL